MPLVRRKIEIENDTTTMQKSKVDHELYVKPRDVKPGDQVIEPTSDRMLAELALEHPEEFEELAKKRGVTPGITQDSDTRAAELQQLNEKDLVKAIADMNPESDAVTLWSVFEIEVDPDKGGTSRPKVLTALSKQGVKE